MGPVRVMKRDGSVKTETVVRVSAPFDVDGVPYCFGYLEEKKFTTRKPAVTSTTPTKRCWECGCSFTYADAKCGGGDWGESYCGC